MTKLAERHCHENAPKLSLAQLEAFKPQIPSWQLTDEGTRLHRTFRFGNFVQAMAFVNRLAEVAEAEDHHPDFSVHYNRVEVSLWTHTAGGVTENDAVLAARLDLLPQ